jgi:hypothetical protein
MKWTPEGRLLMNLGTGAPAADNNAKYAFNRPATLNFRTNGDFRRRWLRKLARGSL